MLYFRLQGASDGSGVEQGLNPKGPTLKKITFMLVYCVPECSVQIKVVLFCGYVVNTRSQTLGRLVFCETYTHKICKE